jgi:hypothetical protein
MCSASVAESTDITYNDGRADETGVSFVAITLSKNIFFYLKREKVQC